MSHQMGTTTRTRLAAVVAVLALGATVVPAAGANRANDRSRVARGLPRVTPVANDALQRALERGRISEGRYALERARSLFHLKKVRKEFGEVARPDPHAATLLLRDLALRLRTLEGDEELEARAILARPDDADDPTFKDFELDGYSNGKVTECSTERNYCLHWAPPEDSNHAPPQTDADANGRPDFVDDAFETMDTVWDDIAALGFRAPKDDGNSVNHGTNGSTRNHTDIYLANIGSARVYGYCSTDDPNTKNSGYQFFDFSAYCVLDNDYAEQAFQSLPPLLNLQVTAAHEFFHAVQFAYDAAEDGWLMEGTAVAMEDIVYDDINDNQQFLMQSQLVDPSLPLDFAHPDFNHPDFGLRYGAWLFWRFMTEYLGGAAGQDDSVIGKVWDRVDASALAKFEDEWSLKGAKNVAKKDPYGVGFKKLFSAWGVALLLPSDPIHGFDEGASYSAFLQSNTNNNRERVPIEKSFTLTRGNPGSGWFSRRLHHLTGRYFRFLPGNNVGANDLLKLKVDGPKKFRGTNVTLVAHDNGNTLVKRFSINKKGIGTVKVPFPDDAYLILQNASTRVKDCYTYKPGFISCGGQPLDDNLRFLAKGRLIRG